MTDKEPTLDQDYEECLKVFPFIKKLSPEDVATLVAEFIKGILTNNTRQSLSLLGAYVTKARNK